MNVQKYWSCLLFLPSIWQRFCHTAKSFCRVPFVQLVIRVLLHSQIVYSSYAMPCVGWSECCHLSAACLFFLNQDCWVLASNSNSEQTRFVLHSYEYDYLVELWYYNLFSVRNQLVYVNSVAWCLLQCLGKLQLQGGFEKQLQQGSISLEH